MRKTFGHLVFFLFIKFTTNAKLKLAQNHTARRGISKLNVSIRSHEKGNNCGFSQLLIEYFQI
jgi:hypothetical protein